MRISIASVRSRDQRQRVRLCGHSRDSIEDGQAEAGEHRPVPLSSKTSSSRITPPSGGLFTGAEQVKTPGQQAIWGGTAGQQFDPCYHEVCDTIDNIDRDALSVNSDLIAFAQLTYAHSTESVNGVPGKKVPGPAFTLPTLAGPEGTFPDGLQGAAGPCSAA